ncbi:hypothetical protein B0H13DRAFT_1952145 [Mycena leptocephala]|nr:hypothetical protein B0H13DRAFT_1952145 [Mycena leptocephala]
MSYQPPHRRQGWNPVRTTFTRHEISDRLHISNANKGSLAVSADGGALSAIFVFPKMQPLFTSSPSQIFCKSNLVSIENHDPGCEYPTFQPDFGGNFRFCGWVRIREVQFLEPQSEGVKKMLRIRWKETSERTSESWEENFNQKWAIVTLEKVEGRKDNPMH